MIIRITHITAFYRIATGIFLCLLPSIVQGQPVGAVVAQDGSGDYPTLQMAIAKAPTNEQGRIVVFVRNGLYKEKIYVLRDNVSLVGESREGVEIVWDDYNGKTAAMNTAESYTLWADGDGFYMENITVRNSAGNVGQAVAIRTTGDRQVFKNCNFIGFQDTFYAHKNRQYVEACRIEGATDFIFGDATAVFQNCEIRCLEGGQFITAPADTKLVSTTGSEDTFYHGLLFNDCKITAAAAVSEQSYYLGRPWQAGASSVFIHCILGDHIKDEGWSEWDNDNHLKGVFAEYKSRDPEGDLIDVGGRVNWSRQLTEEDVNNYYNLNYFLKKEEEWDPLVVTTALPAPKELSADAFELTWNAVEGAAGYLIIRNGQFAGFSTETAHHDNSADPALTNSYAVHAVSKYGGLSSASDPVEVEAVLTAIDIRPDAPLQWTKDRIYIQEKGKIELFTLSGRLIAQATDVNWLTLPYSAGIYILKLTKRDGVVRVKKIAFGGR